MSKYKTDEFGKKLKIMETKYVRAWAKSGTTDINISVSEDGNPRSERNIELKLEPKEARAIFEGYKKKGYLVYDSFITALWEAGDAMKRNASWNQPL